MHYPIKEITYFILTFTKKHKNIFRDLIIEPQLYKENDHLKMRETYQFFLEQLSVMYS